MTHRSLLLVLFLTVHALCQNLGSFPTRSGGSSSNGCALIIPQGQGETCITVADVNAAFSQALRQAGTLRHQEENEKLEERAGEIGAVIRETSRILAQQYRLSVDAISQGLPLIDTRKTIISEFCPKEFIVRPNCEVTRYRSLSGECNNLENPLWGRANVAHLRVLPPVYGDGVYAPRVSVTGSPLPSPRLISKSVHTDNGHHDHAVTSLFVFWGQFMDHDMTLTSETRDPTTRKTPRCCESSNHPNCLTIDVPPNDVFYGKFGQRCINFVRSPDGLLENCRLGAHSTFNLLSSVIDANTLYSHSEESLAQLRSFKGGELRMLPIFDQFNMKPVLPLKLDEPNEGCIRPSDEVYCFLAGELRINENTALASIHTMMARTHNLYAKQLAAVNPHWTDETIFQETRHIMASVIQHITYNEFLPMLLGKEIMKKYGLILLKDGYYTEYDPTVNPTVSSVFAQAVFRLGHTLLPSTMERWSKTHRYIKSARLHEVLQQPYDLFKAGILDNMVTGLINQVAQAYDNSITQEVTDHLFQEPDKDFGLDLAALNIQRAREHGIPSYNTWRELCGLRPFRSWDELYGTFNNQTITGWRKYYSSVEDIDLWSAGVSEFPLPGSMTGPTFGCLTAKQFQALRVGDRFWYENGGWPSSFTLEQLNEIRKIKLSTIICDTMDEMDTIQVYAMVLPDHEINPRLPCKGGFLPRINFSKWTDASFHQSPPVGRPF